MIPTVRLLVVSTVRRLAILQVGIAVVSVIRETKHCDMRVETAQERQAVRRKHVLGSAARYRTLVRPTCPKPENPSEDTHMERRRKL